MIGVGERLNVGKKQSFFPQKMVRLGSNRGHLLELSRTILSGANTYGSQELCFRILVYL